MLKPHLSWVCIFLLLTAMFPASAAYDRNQAVPVEKVEYGQIVSVRNITQKQLIEDQNRGWKTFGGALIGGVIGNQFGGGNGRTVATILGALVGAGVGNNVGNDPYYQETLLVELMIKQEDGQEIMILQDRDPNMIFNVNDEVRVVYLKGFVRVDMAM